MSKRKKIWLGVVVVLVAWLIFDRFVYPDTTPAMIAEAETRSMSVTGQIPPRPFVFDGCTAIPEHVFGWIDITQSCLEHDYAYWAGGTSADRLKADRALRDGIQEKGWLLWPESQIVYWTLRLVGDTFIARAFNRNWGHGYNE